MDYSNASNEQLEQLVNNKDGDAICELGERCLYGTKGHTQNFTRAYQLFHKGEKMGLSSAYRNLGDMYANGLYFAKNVNLANEYYSKAGVSVKPEIKTDIDFSYKEEKTPLSPTPSLVFPLSTLKQEIEMADAERAQGNHKGANFRCNDILKKLQDIELGIIQSDGTEDIDKLKIDTYWVMAFSAYNEKHYQEMENYLAQEGVQALHPWGAYIAAASHQSCQAPDIVMEQDLNNLIMISNNQNMTGQERGDICVMIGDLILSGYGGNTCTQKTAYSYIKQAVDCGNEYANVLIGGFQVLPNGDVQYAG